MKPLSDFAGCQSKGKKVDTYCRPCRAEYGREHYEANRQRYIDQARRRKEEVRAINYELLIRFLRSHPCVDCGEDDVMVLEFDHVAEKSFQITAAITHRSWSDIVVEIAKCEVVCANCHRRRTAQRGGWARFVASQELDDPAA
ncbi:MAG TPA: hypothetical protein VMQ81_13675 [Acidimicrobiia bacterium]|nr:hypothetical protein [Acidimicrobiia bacterium]